MTSLIQKLMLAAVQEFIQKTFTFENVQGARDRFLALLQEQVQTTETGVDDWAYTIVERMVADDNLKKMFDWTWKYADAMFNLSICKAAPEATLKDLAEQMDFVSEGEQVACAMPSLLKIIELLEIIIPILYNWWKENK